MNKKVTQSGLVLHYSQSQIACELFSPREYIPKSLVSSGPLPRQNGQSRMKISWGGQVRKTRSSFIWRRHTYEGELDQPDKDLHCLITCPQNYSVAWVYIYRPRSPSFSISRSEKPIGIMEQIDLNDATHPIVILINFLLKVNDTIFLGYKRLSEGISCLSLFSFCENEQMTIKVKKLAIGS